MNGEVMGLSVVVVPVIADAESLHQLEILRPSGWDRVAGETRRLALLDWTMPIGSLGREGRFQRDSRKSSVTRSPGLRLSP